MATAPDATRGGPAGGGGRRTADTLLARRRRQREIELFGNARPVAWRACTLPVAASDAAHERRLTLRCRTRRKATLERELGRLGASDRVDGRAALEKVREGREVDLGWSLLKGVEPRHWRAERDSWSYIARAKARKSPAFRALLPPRVHTQMLFNTTRSRIIFDCLSSRPAQSERRKIMNKST